MCVDCGCGDGELVPVEVHERILAGNDRTASHNREHFVAGETLAINLMGSPGAGKTALLEATARRMGAHVQLAALSGDLATDNDARRLEAAGIPARSITTGSACHLDAAMVHHALHDARFGHLDVLFVENVGNLVCPAVYDLGQAANVVALSVTEGEDKPLKYPVMFRIADLVVITKTDLAPYVDVKIAALRDNIARVMPTAAIVEVSAKTGAGMDDWIAWIHRQRGKLSVEHVKTHRHEHEHRHQR